MPADYTFGITAASAETPDSFETNKFRVWSSRSAGQDRSAKRQESPSQASTNAQAVNAKSYDPQFEDLQARVQGIQGALEKLEQRISSLSSDTEGRHRELSRNIQSRETLNAVTAQGDKIDRIERTINSFQSQFSNLHGVLRDSHESLTESLPRHMTSSKFRILNPGSSVEWQILTFLVVITTNAPRMGLLITVFVVVQVLLYGVYTLYKRRSKQGPKKYL